MQDVEGLGLHREGGGTTVTLNRPSVSMGMVHCMQNR